MRRLLLLLALSTLVATAAYGMDSDCIGTPQSPTGHQRSEIPALANWAVGGAGNVDIYCVGIGYDAETHLFWVTGADFDGDGSNGNGDNGVYFYDEYGTYIGGFPQPSQDMWGWRDSGYYGTHFLFGASSPHTGQMFVVNAATLAVDQMITSACMFSQCRAIAVTTFEAGMVEYKVGDFSQPIESRVWEVGTPTAISLGTCAAPATGPYGFAYDSSQNGFYMTTASSTGELYFLNLGCSVLALYNQLPEVATFGGACMADTRFGCILATIGQTSPTDSLWLWNLTGENPWACGGPSPVEPASWGAIKARYND